MKIRIGLLAALLWLTPLVSYGAPILNVDQNGELLGASGVEVFTGVFYNVEFVDASCLEIFDGCDAVSDFTFQTSEGAVAASAALLSQVFLDGPFGLFDSNPLATLAVTRVNFSPIRRVKSIHLTMLRLGRKFCLPKLSTA